MLELIMNSSKHTYNNNNSQAGNVFFYIFIAIALFAMLSYVVSRDNDSSSTMFTEEQAKLAAQEIIEYGNTVANAVQKLRLRGCSDTEISFANDSYTYHNGTLKHPAGHNPNARTDETCDVYKEKGGGIIPRLLPNNQTVQWSVGPTNSAIGSFSILNISLPNVANHINEEIVLIAPYIRQEICLEINKLLNIENASDTSPPQTTGNYISFYNGTFLDDGTYSANDDDNLLSGKFAYCAKHPTTNPYDMLYIHTLIAR